MATLISTSVTEPLAGSWPQIMTIVQEFDQPVIVTEDFQLVFYTYNENQLNVPAQMASKPIQFVPTQLSYTMQVSPFADGRVGIYSIIGAIQDIYGNAVDLKIGDDFDIYNTTLRPYYGSPILEFMSESWPDTSILPSTAVCPNATAPQFQIKVGPWNSSMAIPEGGWNEGDFYYWVNYAFKPETAGVPFVWEPPFFYAYSGFGFPLNQTITPPMPPYLVQEDSILYNVTSSGDQGTWNTCGWLNLYQKWQCRLQVWVFGDDAFGTGVAPFPNFPAVADPEGNLSPLAQFGFPPDAQLQFYLEHAFTYTLP
jgi:hypothetical protein